MGWAPRDTNAEPSKPDKRVAGAAAFGREGRMAR
jgi:hypothetical protein